MTVLVLGPSGSGKSAYAERLISGGASGAPYYVATMIPFGEDGRVRVEKHRKQREALGFITVEKPHRVSEIPLPRGASVLLEDVSNLLGNALFGVRREGDEIPDAAAHRRAVCDAVFEDIAAMCARCRAAALVSIEGLTPRPGYDDETRGYIDALNRLNLRLSGFAETVVAMRGGMPAIVRGDAHALD